MTSRSKSFPRILDIPHFPVGQGGNALKCREHFKALATGDDFPINVSPYTNTKAFHPWALA